jgi:xanthine dehydrogenase accessory factor
MLNDWNNLLDVLRDGGTLVLVVEAEGSSPARPGAKMAVLPNGKSYGTVGGGSVEVEAVKEAIARFNSGEKGCVRYDLSRDGSLGSECGGFAVLYFEPVKPARTLWLFGAGHVGKATAKAASLAGWRVVAIDDRPGAASKENVPEASDWICEDYAKAASFVPLRKEDSVVILTAGHLGDEVVMREILKRGIYPEYFGMIGSRNKIAQMFERLKKEGFDENRIKTIRAPIGLNIGTVEPGEIAIAIVAEMLAVRNGVKDVKPCFVSKRE